MKVSEKPHVVLVPFPALGHSIPFFDLARLLSSHGAAVSYVTTPAGACRVAGALAEAQSASLDIRLLVLPTPAVQGLPEGRESTDVIPTKLVNLIFDFAEKLAEPFECWLHQQLQEQEPEKGTGRSPPVCIISDIFMPWILQTGEKYGVPPVLFNTCGVLSPKLLSRGCGMLINTFEELEPAHLSKMRILTGKPIWSIGPVLPPNFAGKAGRGKMEDISEDELVQWLNSQRPHSVLYVSFGSQAFLSERQTAALARGLEASEQPFVWAIKCPPKLEFPGAADTAAADTIQRSYLPEGFEERMESKGLGLIIWGWAPQLLILSHTSLGAFMTHCGWNSTLESITLGIPLITWPMFGDQPFNSENFVEQLGIGIQFCQGRNVIPKEERVEEVVRLVLTEDKGKEMKRGAEKLKEMASKAVGEGGSSKTNLQAFVRKMQKLMIMRTYDGKKKLGIRSRCPPFR